MCKNKENITWTNNKVAPQHVFSISTYSHVWVPVKQGWRMTDDGCGWENEDRKMRMEKNVDNKKSKREKKRNADGRKRKKQTH